MEFYISMAKSFHFYLIHIITDYIGEKRIALNFHIHMVKFDKIEKFLFTEIFFLLMTESYVIYTYRHPPKNKTWKMQLECQVRLRSFKGGPKPETGLPSTQSQGTLYSKRRKAIKRASGSNINMFQESSLSRLLIYLKATFYILNNLQTRRWRRKFENEHRLCMTAGVLLI